MKTEINPNVLENYFKIPVDLINSNLDLITQFVDKFNFKPSSNSVPYEMMVVNLKTNKHYSITGLSLNCTNKDDGIIMVDYTDHTYKFTRSMGEFMCKFTLYPSPKS